MTSALVAVEPSGSQAHIVFGENRTRDRRIVLNLGSQILLFQPAQDLKVSLRTAWGGTWLDCGTWFDWARDLLAGRLWGDRIGQAQEHGCHGHALAGRAMDPTFRLQLRAKRLHGS